VPEHGHHPAHPHSHGSHTHGGHTHDHEHPDHPDDDGRRVRAAKDRPGRHDENYYGQRAASEPEAPAAKRQVGAGQGTRSFAAGGRGGARRRPV
jgi:hypothetical protein